MHSLRNGTLRVAVIDMTAKVAAMQLARFRADPFRIFFPFGVLLAWVGIGHWLLYALGATASYSCLLHGLVQMQAFMMAFALGFLWTALPRRTRTPPASAAEMLTAVGALLVTTAAAAVEHWALAEMAYGALVVLLVRFTVRRVVGRLPGRRPPPASFVLIPLGLLQGLVGAILILVSTAPNGPAWPMGLGRLLVEQGVFLCLVIGIGGLILPLVWGRVAPRDVDAGWGEVWKAVVYAGAGVAIFASLVAEHAGWERAGPLVRAMVVALALGAGGGAWRKPEKPGLHRRLVWLAVWLIPLGLLGAGLWPVYRVPALHVLFIGGFSLLAFGIATHVSLGHLGLDALAFGRPPVVIVLAVCVLLAMLARVAADASDTYFDHLGWASGSWLAGSAAWLAFFGPKLLRR